MEELIFFLLNLLAEALGLKKKRAALPPVPRVPANVLSPRPPAAMPSPPVGPQRTIARPAGDDLSPVPQQATSLSFAQRVSVPLQQEPSVFAASRVAASLPPPPAPKPPMALFASGDDLVRAFIMQEILQAPRALRPHRLPAVSPPSPAPED